MSNRLTVAIQKSGRLASDSLELLDKCGIQFVQSKDKLFWFGKTLPVDLLLVRDDDIPQFLLDGVCDIGIVGENVADEARLEREAEQGPLQLPVLRRLNYGQCRLSIAVPETQTYDSVSDLNDQRIATSYPRLTRAFLDDAGVNAKIIKLSGSVEIAPSLGTADCIVDLVSTGSTLRANHLREVEDVMDSRAALYQSPNELAANKQVLLNRLLLRIDGVLQVKESKYVMLHAPRSALAQITELLPGAESPTVLPLEGETDRVAVHAVCTESVFWEHLEALKAIGASAVLVLPVEKMLA